MGLLDLFKKKEQKVADNGALALDELPPISLPESDSSFPQESDLPPTPSVDELNQPFNSDQPASEAFATSSEEGLEVPPSAPVNNELFAELNESLAQDQSTQVADYAASPQEAVLPNEQADEVPSQEEVEETLLPEPQAPQDFDQENQEELSESNNDLPDFESLQEDVDETPGEQLAISSGRSVDVRTENLLLKSIFVERDHYASILFSLKRVKDDLQKSAPQQRKLSNIDMKSAKEYGKLSTLFENFNENVMIIEHIVSNEKF